jgi:hypothetical protein
MKSLYPYFTCFKVIPLKALKAALYEPSDLEASSEVIL